MCVVKRVMRFPIYYRRKTAPPAAGSDRNMVLTTGFTTGCGRWLCATCERKLMFQSVPVGSAKGRAIEDERIYFTSYRRD